MSARYTLIVAAALGTFCLPVAAQTPLGTVFTYQGRLKNAGSPASGLHDLRFRLYDASVGGAQVGTTVCAEDVSVTDGLFTVPLDFGAQFAGEERFLEIDVRADTELGCGDGTGYATLAPRQPLTAAPNALFALNATTATTATNATQLNGQAATFYQNAANLSSGTIPDARLAGAYSGLLSLSNVGNAFTGAFSGSGAGLTGLNASNIASGLLDDARLSGNVALLNVAQTFNAGKTFSAAPLFIAAGSPFLVTSTTLVANLNADHLDGLDSTAFLQSIPVPLTLSGTNATHIIHGENASTVNFSAGVTGWSTAVTGNTAGVYAQCVSSTGRGVWGAAGGNSPTNTAYGVFGFASTATSGYGVYALGNTGASGTKSFRIDHPDDPAKKYLLHYAAESPEVINFYSGKSTLDGAGEAVVELPHYFAKINKDPRYTLTAVGAPMPMLHVAEEIDEAALSAGEKAGPGEAGPLCSFRIAGGAPGLKVSWEVKALRNDLRIRLHGAPVEREKTGAERGTYQHPEYYGQPPERGMNYRLVTDETNAATTGGVR